MLKKIYGKIKKEKILVISAICAIVTMFFVRPDKAYLGYINLNVLCLLFCLMAVVNGFKSCGAFEFLAVKLSQNSRDWHILGFVLVMLPFFVSMVVTNDVSLLTFVPFTISLLENINCEKSIIPVLALQTVAANLGSMATPIGNPQNLFLYSNYNLSAGDFFSCMLPLTVVSFLFLAIASFFTLPKNLPTLNIKGEISSSKNLKIYTLLFALCLLTVFRIIPYGITTLIILAVVFALNRNILKELDYALLLTFVCFFIVSGNLGRIEVVQIFLRNFLEKSVLLTSIGASQIISNVPAAVLLSSFTNSWKELLQGVNIGGLGTPIASLASLITLKLYIETPNSKASKFLLFFTVANLLGLVVLIAFALI